MTIDNSSVSGYAALYMRGPDASEGSHGSKVLVRNNSTLSSSNPHAFDNSWNDFGTIVLQTGDITIDVVDSKIAAETSNGSFQSAIHFSGAEDTVNNTVTIKGDSKIELTGDTAKFVTETGIENQVTIEGGEANFEPDTEYISKDKVAIELRTTDFEKYYIGSQKEINNVLNSAPSGSTVTVLQGDVALNIPEAGVEVFNKGDGNVTANGVNVEPNSDTPVITEKQEPTTPQTPDKGDSENTEVAPNTGDSNGNLFLFISLFTATALAAIVLSALRRRHN